MRCLALSLWLSDFQDEIIFFLNPDQHCTGLCYEDDCYCTVPSYDDCLCTGSSYDCSCNLTVQNHHMTVRIHLECTGPSFDCSCTVYMYRAILWLFVYRAILWPLVYSLSAQGHPTTVCVQGHLMTVSVQFRFNYVWKFKRKKFLFIFP